jgi:hypothetical protein
VNEATLNFSGEVQKGKRNVDISVTQEVLAGWQHAPPHSLPIFRDTPVPDSTFFNSEFYIWVYQFLLTLLTSKVWSFNIFQHC